MLIAGAMTYPSVNPYDGKTTPDLPFGRINNSGYGRGLSSLGIEEFVNKKLVRVSAIDAPA